MGLVLTGRPCALTAAPAAPVRVPTIAKWKGCEEEGQVAAAQGTFMCLVCACVRFQ